MLTVGNHDGVVGHGGLELLAQPDRRNEVLAVLLDLAFRVCASKTYEQIIERSMAESPTRKKKLRTKARLARGVNATMSAAVHLS